MATLLALAFVASAVPSWVVDVPSYRVVRQIAAALAVLVMLQLLAVWWLGLHAALSGALAAAGGGSNLPMRLRVARRRARPAAWGVAAVRLLFVLVAALSWLVATGVLGGYDLAAYDVVKAGRNAPQLFLAAVVLGTLSLLVGPFTRLRYSAALGALAGALAERLSLRGWLGVSARLGAGLAGVLGLLWSAAVATLIVLVRVDPFYSSRSPLRRFPGPYSTLDPAVSSWLYAGWAAILLSGVLLAGQIALTPLLVRLARRALARRQARSEATPLAGAPV